MPQDAVELVKDKLEAASLLVPSYHRVIMTLGQVLEGDFFTEYIKLGQSIILRRIQTELERTPIDPNIAQEM